eukprot:TRINITY_DN7205_c0_g1_i3.p1 TRINITY_DN7205_c0_g1~~TRINITY_DN7205_c0_g1_i3.p1  ORF type:complete len:211 (+),score=31.61 TRINITY_DN7205_c0_g1_i3:903-1535(+)
MGCTTSCKGGEIQRTLRASAYLNEHPTHRLRSSLVPADILFDEDGCWRSAEKTGTNKRRRYNNGKEDPQNRTSSYIPVRVVVTHTSLLLFAREEHSNPGVLVDAAQFAKKDRLFPLFLHTAREESVLPISPDRDVKSSPERIVDIEVTPWERGTRPVLLAESTQWFSCAEWFSSSDTPAMQALCVSASNVENNTRLWELLCGRFEFCVST